MTSPAQRAAQALTKARDRALLTARCSCGHAVTQHQALMARSGKALVYSGHCTAVVSIEGRRCPCRGPR
jgi:hypothetical protein